VPFRHIEFSLRSLVTGDKLIPSDPSLQSVPCFACAKKKIITAFFKSKSKIKSKRSPTSSFFAGSYFRDGMRFVSTSNHLRRR